MITSVQDDEIPVEVDYTVETIVIVLFYLFYWTGCFDFGLAFKSALRKHKGQKRIKLLTVNPPEDMKDEAVAKAVNANIDDTHAKIMIYLYFQNNLSKSILKISTKGIYEEIRNLYSRFWEPDI